MVSNYGIQGKAMVYKLPSIVQMIVDVKKGYMLSNKMPVMHLDGGRIKLYRSFRKANGPTFECFIQPTPKGMEVTQVFVAYASVLCMEDMAWIRVSGDKWDFSVSGKIQGKFQRVHTFTSISKQGSKRCFHVSGTPGKPARDAIECKVVHGLEREAEEARNGLKDVNDEVGAIKKRVCQLRELLSQLKRLL